MREFFASGRGRWLLTTGMSYVYFGSILLTTAITIPLALKFLGREQYGLWALSSQLLSFIYLFDGGLSRSLPRLVGESITDPENIATSRKFGLLIGLSFLTACLLMIVALLVSTWGLRFLSVPFHLLGIGQQLFLSVMALQCVGYTLGPFEAVLFAQNRAYITSTVSLMGVWLNAGTFIFLLMHGYGLLSYVFANLLVLPIRAVVSLSVVLRSSHRPKLRFIMPLMDDFKDVFAFSSWMFISVLISESIMALPTMIITKFAGLGAMTLFYISFRPAFFLQRLSCLPFQSLVPRWQKLYLDGNLAKLRHEYAAALFFILQFGLILCTCFVVFLKPLITVWVGAKMYGGTLITASLGFYLIIYLLGSTLGVPFVMAKKLGFLAMVQTFELLLSIPVCIFLAERVGAGGVIFGSVFLTMLFTIQYFWKQGPFCFGFSHSATHLLRGHALAILTQAILAFIAAGWIWWSDRRGLPFVDLLVGGVVIGALALAVFLRSAGSLALRIVRQRRT
jgi:O-antigen/teichoic acid export membrane protein